MAYSDKSSSQGSQSASSVLRAQLAIEPATDSNCAVVNASDRATPISHDVKLDGDACGCGDEDNGECHTELSIESETGINRTYVKSNVQQTCVCPVFSNHDCIPNIKSVRDGRVITTVTVPEREVLREIISDLRRTGADVSLDWLMRGDEPEQTIEINAGDITDKQREALKLAIEMGYYETPRQSTLSDLANELGVTESATSQRLNAAETKLVKSFLEEI